MHDPGAPSGSAGIPGFCGTPRLKEVRDDKGNVQERYSEAGGWDGHNLVADPYGTGIYVTTSCTYGNGQIGGETDIALALRSTDGGATWRELGAIPSGTVWSWRAAISAQSDGRIAFGFIAGTDIKVAVIKPQTGEGDIADLHPVYKMVSESASSKAGVTDDIHFNGMLAYPTLTPEFSSGGFNIAGPDWQDGSLLTFKIHSVDPQFGVKFLRRIAGGQSLQHAYQGTFVTGLPNDPVNVFYWIERYYQGKPISSNAEIHAGFRVRFEAYNGERSLLQKPGYLSLRNGLPYAWVYDGNFVGDYMSGASYRDRDGTRVFVLPWSENGGLRFNMVRVMPGDLGAQVASSVVAVRPMPPIAAGPARPFPPPIPEGAENDIDVAPVPHGADMLAPRR